MTFKTLSVVIPCFNEENTLEALIGRVLAADRCGLQLEIVIVDDKSQDHSLKNINKDKCYRSFDQKQIKAL